MARSPRRIVSPQRRQANAREAVITALQARPGYSGLLLSLRQRWSAVEIRPVNAPFTPLTILDRIQRSPYDTALVKDWEIQPSEALRLYLNKLDDITIRQFHLTDVDTGAAAWWVRQDLHIDTTQNEPLGWGWTDRVDPWRFPAPAALPEWRIAPSAFGVRVTLTTPDTGERVSPEVFPDLASALRKIQEAITRHYQEQGWQRNAATEARTTKQDIPALVQWYCSGQPPARQATQRRLMDLAREVLMLGPPPADAPTTPRKTEGRFFARLAENGAYSEDE